MKSFLIFLLFGFLISQNAMAQSQAERAISAVLELKKSGKIKEGAKLRIMAKEGLIANLWGPDLKLKNEWERRTGVQLVFDTLPNKPVLETLKERPPVDLITARTREYPDLVSLKLIADLTNLFEKYKLNSDNDNFLWDQHTIFNGRRVAVPADCDVSIMYIRTDLLANEENKKNFKAKYGMALKIPGTWEEYEKQLEFFHHPEKKMYGTVEQRDEGSGWMYWMVRYYSEADPAPFLFDDRMNPLINSSSGIAATKKYLATIKYSPPKMLQYKASEASGYSLPLFIRGRAYSYILTPVVAKYMSKRKKLDGKWAAIPMPGRNINGKLVSRPMIIYGNNLVVTNWSQNSELAFLYIMFFTDSKNSAIGLGVANGQLDPFKKTHMKNKVLHKIYSKQFLSSLPLLFKPALPQGTGLPGDAEYIKALNINLFKAAKGELTAEAAMDLTAKRWNTITARYGKKNQMAYLKKFKKLYPAKN